MSYYRPASPPPREPSPEPVHTPLPSPHLRARDRRRTQNTATSPLVPPGLAPPRTLNQSRSFDHLHRDPQHPTLKRRTRSNLDPAGSPPTQPATLPEPHRRTISVSAPRSPPLSPTRSTSTTAPPVPPLPDGARTSPPSLFRPQSKTAVTPIYLPELHDLSPVAQRSTTLSVPSTPAASEKKSVKRLPSLFSISSASGISSKADSTSSPAPEKEPKSKSNVAMTCLKFFTMHRHSSNKSLRSSVTQ